MSSSLASSPEICGHARYGPGFKVVSDMKFLHKVTNIFLYSATIVAAVRSVHSGALLASEAMLRPQGFQAHFDPTGDRCRRCSVQRTFLGYPPETLVLGLEGGL